MEEKDEGEKEGEESKISYDEFTKVKLRTAKILSAEAVEGSEKLVRLQISLGVEERQLLAGIGTVYAPDDLVGKTIVVVVNLKPRKMMGRESNGMLLAASGEDGPVLLIPERDTPAGVEVR